MTEVTRRQTLALGSGVLLTELLAAGAVRAAGKDTLTIAYNVNLPSFDPTDGPSAVNPTIQAIYRSVFDQYIGQAPDLSFRPGLLNAWGWDDDKTKLWMDVRRDVKWHDGSALTPEDVVWSLQRAGAKDSARDGQRCARRLQHLFANDVGEAVEVGGLAVRLLGDDLVVPGVHSVGADVDHVGDRPGGQRGAEVIDHGHILEECGAVATVFRGERRADDNGVGGLQDGAEH